MKPTRTNKDKTEKRPGHGRWSWSMIVIAGLAASGCSSHLKFVEGPGQPAGAFSRQESAKGLTVAVQPITNRTEVLGRFGADLISSRLLPVLVAATNENASSSYVIAPDRFKLINGRYQAKSNQKAEGASTAGASAAGWALAFMGLGPTLIAAPFLSASVDKVILINQHLRQEQLLKQTLSPGEATHGYVYFNVPEDKKREPVWTLVVQAVTLPGGEEMEITFPYNW